MHMFKSIAFALAAFGATTVVATDAKLSQEIKQITDLAAAIEAAQQQAAPAVQARSQQPADLAQQIKQITDLAAAIEAGNKNVQARSTGPSQAEIDELARQIAAGSPRVARRDAAEEDMPSRAEIDALADQISELSARAFADDHLQRRTAADGMPTQAEINALSQQIEQLKAIAAQQQQKQPPVARPLPPRLAARNEQLQARGIKDFFKNAFRTVTNFFGGLFGGGR